MTDKEKTAKSGEGRSREDYAARKQERIDRKVAMAGREDTAVRIVRTIESRLLLEMQPSADMSLSNIRAKIGIDPRYTLEKAGKYTERFMTILTNMDTLVKEMCDMTGVRYRQPSILRARDKNAGDGEEKAEAQSGENAQGEFEAKPAEVVTLEEGAGTRKAKKSAASA